MLSPLQNFSKHWEFFAIFSEAKSLIKLDIEHKRKVLRVNNVCLIVCTLRDL